MGLFTLKFAVSQVYWTKQHFTFKVVFPFQIFLGFTVEER